MQNTNCRGTINSNQGSPAEAWADSRAGSEKVGRATANPAPLGVRATDTPRLSPENPPRHFGHNPGGQASLSTFGCPGSSRHAAAQGEAPSQAQAQAQPEAARPQPQGARVAYGQTYSQRARRYSHGIRTAAIEARQADAARTAGQEPSPLQQDLAAARAIAPAAGTLLAMPSCWQQPVPTPKLSPEATVAALDQLTPEQANRLVGALQGMVQTTPAFHARIVEALALIDAPAAVQPVAPRPQLSRECLSVFATLATVEQRPVVEVIEECLADMAAHLARTRHSLHLDAQDTAALNAYLDDLERQEREEDEAAARLRTTPAMRQAAAAADERERHPLPDLEEWDRTLPFGHVETALARA